jgi:hypothetical protein
MAGRSAGLLFQSKPMSLAIPLVLHAELQARANAIGMTQSEFVRGAIRNELNRTAPADNAELVGAD